MKKVLIVDAHPDGGRFATALADACAEGARDAGAEVRRLALRDLRFDPILRRGFRGGQPWEVDLEGAWADVQAVDHLIWVFPVWWGGLPALLKGFVDRLFLPGLAFSHGDRGLPDGLLAGRTSRVVATMDSPWWWYWLKHGRAAHRQLVQATLHYVGIVRVAESTVYALRTLDGDARSRALDRVRRDVRADLA